jgi:glycosyltransferase involved in cell wall biosynthesis
MTKPFIYNPNAFGGTEYMGRGWHKTIAPYMPKLEKYNAYIIPGMAPDLKDIVKSDKQLIVWMHNKPQQFDEYHLQILKNPKFLEKVKYFVVPSEHHKRLTLEEIEINPECIYVIPNAIEPLLFDKSKFYNPSTIKLIHTSTLDRGLEILLYAIPHIKEDIRVEVYNEFYPDLQQEVPVFDSRIKFYGKTPKATVLEAIENSHIHAYPSTYPETFCMSQVEAMSAGLACVTSDLGALPEVSGGFGYMYEYTSDKQKHTELFIDNLNKAINDIRNNTFDPTAQIEYVNNTYSWEAIKQKWIEFHDLI